MASILSGSFHHVRNFHISYINIRILRFSSGKYILDQCNTRSLTTRAQLTREGPQNDTPESIKLHIGKAEVVKPRIEPIQCYPALPKEEKLEAKMNRSATILVFDLETTGVNSPRERIIEFAARNLMGGRNSTFQTLINPEIKIKNSHIHGITDSMVNRPRVPRIEDVIPLVIEWVRIQQEPGKPVVWLAHNGKTFDFPFFLREMSHCGYDIPDDWRFFDTLPLAKKLVDPTGKLKGRSIKDLCMHFDIIVNGPAHRAMADVNMLSLIYQRLTISQEFTSSNLIEESLTASDIKWKPRTER
ncbi:hypothetical protein LUZ61_016657 [Rhynchospora tenuis]|uniref:Exonuclease domain-containing protein n=1 Tax=Rhynchospora tenuis TaxID=198213 RepID=A0AAD5Z5Y3_9POAL|nr:hypothetical protein LUZ61_016657 [Rhynchospora tenuis]